MPEIYRNESFKGFTYAVWHIIEQEDYFIPKLQFGDWEKKYFESVRSPKRRLAWLASRHLLKLVLGTDAFVELLFDTQGKPYLGNYDVKISLSHTDNYAAVIVSKDFEVGIDIEDPSRDISILRNKFLSQEENNQLIHSDLKLELMLYWSAKEVVYKIYGKRKLDFKEDMFIKPFKISNSGFMKGLLLKHGMVAQYNLHYMVKPNYCVVFGTDTDIEILGEI
ncbi:MAG: 4'-phosphopantetheinyl transferase superfamily protein [Chitinophagales bacterium]